jgi:hypothetical protein
VLWVVASPSALHTDHMTGTTTVATFVGTNGFQLTTVGLKAGVRTGGRSVTVELTRKEVGTFEIKCLTYCGRGPGRTKASIDRDAAHLNAQ